MADLTLRNKSAEILSKPNNPELEMDFRATCPASQINPSLYDPPLMQAYQDHLNACQHGASLYNLRWYNNRTNLIIYDTETETHEVKTLQTLSLDSRTCITQLPNGKLFCFGSNSWISGITVLIDTNGGVEVLPSWTPCTYSSCIYFNSSVYCFGGYNEGYLTLSSRFDLDQNRWIQLTPMRRSDFRCNSIMFNRNILISGYHNRNLLLYSIDIEIARGWRYLRHSRATENRLHTGAIFHMWSHFSTRENPDFHVWKNRSTRGKSFPCGADFCIARKWRK